MRTENTPPAEIPFWGLPDENGMVVVYDQLVSADIADKYAGLSFHQFEIVFEADCLRELDELAKEQDDDDEYYRDILEFCYGLAKEQHANNRRELVKEQHADNLRELDELAKEQDDDKLPIKSAENVRCSKCLQTTSGYWDLCEKCFNENMDSYWDELN